MCSLSRVVSLRFACAALSALLAGCVSVESKGSLPADWQAVLETKSVPDISGEYRFSGEGELVPDPRITAFLPFQTAVDANPKKFVLRQMDSTHVVVQFGERGTPLTFEVRSDPATGEVTLPSFSKVEHAGYLPSTTSIKVVFKKGSDGALYANRVSMTAGSAEKLILPMAGVLGRWCRFLPTPVSTNPATEAHRN